MPITSDRRSRWSARRTIAIRPLILPGNPSPYIETLGIGIDRVKTELGFRFAQVECVADQLDSRCGRKVGGLYPLEAERLVEVLGRRHPAARMQCEAVATVGSGAGETGESQRPADATALACRIHGQHPHSGLTLGKFLRVGVVRATDVSHAAEQLALRSHGHQHARS